MNMKSIYLLDHSNVYRSCGSSTEYRVILRRSGHGETIEGFAARNEAGGVEGER